MLETFDTLPLERFDLRFAPLRLKRPELQDAMRRSIEQHGLQQPLVVNATGDGAMVVLDGFKRLEALGQLGHHDVPVRVLRLDEPAAQAAILSYNVAHQGLCELEEAWIVHSLVRSCQLRQTEVAELVGHHKSWVCRRLQLAERLAAPLQDDMRLGLLKATTAREMARLPRGNQAEVAEAVRQHGLTTRQTAAVVDKVISAAEPSAVETLLHDPLRFVTPPKELGPAKDPRLTDKAESVRRSLLRLSQGAADVSHRLGRLPVMALGDLDAEVLADIASPIVVQTEQALALTRQLLRRPPE